MTPPRPPQARRLAALAALVVFPALAQSPPASPKKAQRVPVFPSEVELITVDAAVLDSAGRAVAGLTQDDFTLTENGRPVEIARFEAFVLEPAPVKGAGPGSEAVATNAADSVGARRAFAIILDDLRIAPQLSEEARRAVRSILDAVVRDGDEVVLAATSGDVWWTARTSQDLEDLRALLGRIDGRNAVRTSYDRMSEYEAFRIANFEDKPSVHDNILGSPTFSVPGQAAAAAQDILPSGLSVRERVKRRWQDLGICVPVSCDGEVRARAQEIDQFRRNRTKAVLAGIRLGLEALATVRGRKALIFLSEGFLDDPSSSDRRAVASVSREANTAVYFMDVRGLVTQPGFGSSAESGPPPDPQEAGITAVEDSVLESAGAQTLADETGGFSLRNSNDFDSGAKRIGEESRVFYLLGFYPPEGKPARAWRKLEVGVKRPGLTVRARRGYSLVTGAGEEPKPRRGRKDETPELPAATLRAVNSPHDDADIPLRAMAYVLEPRRKDLTRVLVAVEFDADRLTYWPVGRARRTRVAASVVARLRDAARGFRHDDTLELTLFEGDAGGWRSHAREFLLPAGVAQVRVVLRDETSGALGSTSVRVEVPPRDTLRLSTPILTDQVEPDAGQGNRPQVVLAVHREFPVGGRLYVEFEVFGAARGVDGRPRVSAAMQLRGADGRLASEASASPIAPASDGRLVRFVGIDLHGLEAGPYELVLDISDQVSGRDLRGRERFSLTSAGQ
jgi:VWFA-related protein